MSSEREQRDQELVSQPIPDAWHTASYLQTVLPKLREAIEDDLNSDDVMISVAFDVAPELGQAERMGQLVLDLWHQAHALKRRLEALEQGGAK